MTIKVHLTRSEDELAERFRSLKEPRDVADLLEVPYPQLHYIISTNRNGYPYSTFEIAKKGGGTREISAPHASLKILQQKLNTVLRSVYRPRRQTHGFVPKRSIVTNARVHSGRNFVLNIDLEDFFPSINFGRIRGLFIAKPYELDARVATVFALICCEKNETVDRLPQGAPTSPVLSNMICRRMDRELDTLARRAGCAYTRYADDLTFSTGRAVFSEEIAIVVRDGSERDVVLSSDLVRIIENNGFSVNSDKVRIQRRAQHQEVTGLTVNEFPNVRRTFVRQLRAMIHAWRKHGYEAADAEYRARYDWHTRGPERLPVAFRDVVLGKLSFLKMVRGEANPTYRNLRSQLAEIAPDLLSPVGSGEEPGGGRQASAVRVDWQEWHSRYEEYVWIVEVHRHDGGVSSGTAFIWRPHLLASAAHVFDGTVQAGRPVGDELISLDSIRKHASAEDGIDIAVARLPDTSPEDRELIPVRPDLPQPGEEVAALGCPSIPGQHPRVGIYTGRVESITPTYGGQELIQVSIPFAGGLSGGPVIDTAGRLVGIVSGQSFEQARPGVPKRDFPQVVPVAHLRETVPE